MISDNRLLDFRAWHLERKEFLHVYAISMSDWNGRTLNCECNNGWVTIWPKLDEVVLQQRTPFCDVDGEKIYIGDTLGYDGCVCGSVEFNEKLGAYVVQYKVGPTEDEKHIDDVAFLFNFTHCHIVGNIFQGVTKKCPKESKLSKKN